MSKKKRPEGPRGATVRVKTARGRSNSSARWLNRQLNDPYVQKAKAEGYRGRAAFKLTELDDRFGLLKGARRIVDLGAAPGGWMQVALQRSPGATIIGIDLLEIDPLPGTQFIQLDFMDESAPQQLKEMLGGSNGTGLADIVLSDMAPNASGNPSLDHLRIMGLVENAAHFAMEVLRPGGVFVAKVWQGGAESELLKELRLRFASVKHAKPAASRKDSAETYLVATGFKG